MTPWAWFDKGALLLILCLVWKASGVEPTLALLSYLGWLSIGIGGVTLAVRIIKKGLHPMPTICETIANAAKLLRECAAWEVQFGKHGLFAQAALPKDFRAELRKAADDLDAIPPPEKPRASEEPGGYYSEI